MHEAKQSNLQQKRGTPKMHEGDALWSNLEARVFNSKSNESDAQTQNCVKGDAQTQNCVKGDAQTQNHTKVTLKHKIA
jgi:hypothetical protein